jgi:large subunit ribosomal protein L4
LKVSDEIFGLEPRQDLMQRMVRWQLAKKQQGTHKTKGRSEISRTGAKMFKQKGRAAPVTTSRPAVPRRRQGSWSGRPQPRPRSSQEGSRLACVMRCRPRQGVRHDRCRQPEGRSQDQGADRFASEAGADQCAVHRRRRVDENFRLAAKNIPNVDVLPVQGINVYDILRRNKLVLSKDAVEALEERFK